ncbi:hypothetical protein TNCV_4141551 [Trichonephila clavipes]|nr:hypothetical protein TNCV_4141551 [Trichonephila clavipes]
MDKNRRTTPEKSPPSPNYHTKGRALSLDKFTGISLSQRWIFSGTATRTSDPPIITSATHVSEKRNPLHSSEEEKLIAVLKHGEERCWRWSSPYTRKRFFTKTHVMRFIVCKHRTCIDGSPMVSEDTRLVAQ